MTKTNLKWRLSKLPTVEELQSLIKDEIITKEEAKDILFSSESQEDKDVLALEAEIKYLKEIIENLSRGTTKTIEIVERPYRRWEWYGSTATWLADSCGFTTTGVSGNTVEYSVNNSPQNLIS